MIELILEFLQLEMMMETEFSRFTGWHGRSMLLLVDLSWMFWRGLEISWCCCLLVYLRAF